MSVASIAPGGGGRPLSRSMLVSALLHGSVIVAAIVWQGGAAPERPPVYKVSLVGAPAGPKNIGVVDPTPPKAPAAAAEAPSGVERPPEEMVAPTATKAPPKPAPKATPTPARTTKAGQDDGEAKPKTSDAPRAGSTTGGKGADVVTVETNGIEFPSQVYLNNIVRQVELRFRPDTRFENRPLSAEVSFLIHQDGSVSDIRVEKSSTEYRFDVYARSAVESAGNAQAFGPLPAEWPSDVLRVYFNFSPKGMR